MDTVQIKEVIKLASDGLKLGLQIGKDKAVGVQDLPMVLQIVQDLPAAISGIDQVPAELSDLDPMEAADLVAFTMNELALDEGKAKAVVQASLSLLVAAAGLVKALA